MATRAGCRGGPAVLSRCAGEGVSGCRGEVLVEDLSGGAPSERLARAAVERVGDGGQVAGAVAREVGALGEVLAQQPVGVLVGAALPGALRIAEVHLQAEVDPQPGCWASSAPWSHVNE